MATASFELATKILLAAIGISFIRVDFNLSVSTILNINSK
jgi:hypothetical protein